MSAPSLCSCSRTSGNISFSQNASTWIPTRCWQLLHGTRRRHSPFCLSRTRSRTCSTPPECGIRTQPRRSLLHGPPSAASLADFYDASLLDDAPPRVRRLLRTIDVEILGRVTKARPGVVPDPPPAGHDQTISRWRADIDSRLEQYIASSTHQDRVLIGASSRLTVLNWGHLEEELLCGTTVGTSHPVHGRIFARQRSTILRDLVSTPTVPLAQKGRAPRYRELRIHVSSAPHRLAVISSRPGCCLGMDARFDSTGLLAHRKRRTRCRGHLVDGRMVGERWTRVR